MLLHSLDYGEQETFSAWLRVVYDGICAPNTMTSRGLAHERKHSEDAQRVFPGLEIPRVRAKQGVEADGREPDIVAACR